MSGGFAFPAHLRGMDRRTLALAAVVMLLGVALGAFGAHGLKPRIGPDALANWHTGVLYQFIHGAGLLFLSLAGEHVGTRYLRLARTLFLGGVVCFSGSLYLLSTRELLGTQGLTPVLGPITPLGGLLYMGGWTVLLVSALRRS
jgi:uncharacterized membrane protein YgdD (TMEM256/DUF423 family)